MADIAAPSVRTTGEHPFAAQDPRTVGSCTLGGAVMLRSADGCSSSAACSVRPSGTSRAIRGTRVRRGHRAPSALPPPRWPCGAAVEQGHLAEERSPSQPGDEMVLVSDLGVPVRDHEELRSALTCAGQHSAGRNVHSGHERLQAEEVPFTAAGEAAKLSKRLDRRPSSAQRDDHARERDRLVWPHGCRRGNTR